MCMPDVITFSPSTKYLRPEACNLIKKETLAQVLACEFYEISENIFLHRTRLVAASVYVPNWNMLKSAPF